MAGSKGHLDLFMINQIEKAKLLSRFRATTRPRRTEYQDPNYMQNFKTAQLTTMPF